MHHGLSRTTVAELRRRFADIAYSGDETNAAFLDDVNEILEYIHTIGDWKGNSGVWSFTVSSTGRITLPYYLESILACRMGTADFTSPRPLVSQGFEFLHYGPGDLEDQGLAIAVSEGDVAIEVEFPAATNDTISIISSQTEAAGTTLRLYGLDANGDEVRDALGLPGEEVAVAATSSNNFSAVTGVKKPVTKGRVTLTLDTSTPLVLSAYEPHVTHPVYHRYKVDPISSTGSTGVTTVEAWCSRRFVPVRNEEDWVVPGTMRGWRLAFMAQVMDIQVNKNKTDYWAESLKAFNQEVVKYKGGENVMMNVHLHGLHVHKIDPIK